MARVGIIQPSFAAGELSPRLLGRTDYAKYAQGAEAIENFVVRPEGGLQRRHGTRFAGETKNHLKASVLVPFIVSTIQAYMLEMGDQYIRFWKNGAPIVSATRTITNITKANPAQMTVSGGAPGNGARILVTGVLGMGQVNNREFIVSGSGSTFSLSGVDSTGYDAYTSGGTASIIYEIASPYLEADLATLVTTQSADTLYIVHANYAPRTLVRTTDTSWALATINLSKGPFATVNTDESKRIFIYDGAIEPGETGTVESNADIFEAGHVGSFMYVEEIYFADRDVTPYGPERVNNVNPAVGDEYSNDGKVYLCVRSIGDQLSGQVPPTHEIGEAWDAPQSSVDRALWRYLHSRWCVIELTGFTSSKMMSCKAVTRVPSGLDPNGVTITGAVSGTGGVIRLTSANHGYGVGDYVQVASVGGVPNATGNWRVINATTTTFELEGSTFAGAFTSGGSAIRWATFLWRHGAFSSARGWPKAVCIHEQRLCYANTTLQPFGFWASKAGDYRNHLPGKEEDDEAIAYNVAGNQVDPIRWLMSAANIVLGTLAVELAAYGGGLGDPITPSNTRIVPQSGEGSNATPPVKAGRTILFVNRAGRKLFALDYRSEFDQYVAEDLIERAAHLTVGKTIVRMAWSKNPLSALWLALSDGSLVSMTFRPDQELLAWARHPLTNGAVENVATIPSQDGLVDDVWMVVRRTIGGATKRYIEILARPFEATSPTDKTAMGFMDSALNYSGAAVSSFSGLFHLEGQSVQIVANGARQPPATVTGGKITLGAPATNVWAGLGYVSRLKTVRPEAGAPVTAQGKTKRIARSTIRVFNSLGGKCGPYDESVMDPILPAADISDPAAQLVTGDRDVFLASDYGLDGRISIVQDEPMPLDVLSIMPLITVNE